MNKTISTILAACLIWLPSQAQSFKDKIAADPDRAGGPYHSYEYVEAPSTPAPDGYRPFYISHYGRHGSRYHINLKYFEGAVKMLDSARVEGLLTDEGVLLSRQMDTLLAEHQGMAGMLTERGAGEHRGIASRMFTNYEEVFSGRRNEVACVSSYISRCLISMSNFTAEFLDCANLENIDGLNFSFRTGPKYLDYISADVKSNKVYDKEGREKADSFRRASVSTDRFLSAIFKNPETAASRVGDPMKFVQEVFVGGGISQCTNARPDIFSHFTLDELYGLWKAVNYRMYNRYVSASEFGGYFLNVAKPLIADFVEKADEALEKGSRRAADLRFGHDTGLLPFISAIGLGNLSDGTPVSDAQESFATFEMIPMGSNIQMIFYENASGNVIVKMLYNEKETSLPALGKGPYYLWKELRSYLVDRMNALDGSLLEQDTKESEHNGI
jgi:hypothetical protein